MTEVELEVDDRDVKPGDVVVDFHWVHPGKVPVWQWAQVPGRRVIDKVDESGLWYSHSGSWVAWHRYAQGPIRCKVRRKAQLVTTQPMCQGTVNLGPPTKKAIPDWPLSCPKCGRASSAVLLFMGYDCKHGCFK